jgi:hypothetical protein
MKGVEMLLVLSNIGKMLQEPICVVPVGLLEDLQGLFDS